MAAVIPKVEQFRRVVLKVGSSLLVDRSRGEIKEGWLAALAQDIADLHGRGADVLVVSSGAIALGRTVLGLPRGELKLEESQAAAAAPLANTIVNYVSGKRTAATIRNYAAAETGQDVPLEGVVGYLELLARLGWLK